MTRRKLAAILLIGLNIWMGLVSCGRHMSTENTTSGTDIGAEYPTDVAFPQPPVPQHFENVDQFNADQVAEAVTREFFSWNIAEDAGVTDAAERAKPLMDEPFVEQTEGQWGMWTRVTGPTWRSFKDANATVSVEVTPNGEETPQDAELTKYRVYTVTQHILGDNFERHQRYTVKVTVTKLGVWRVSAFVVDGPTDAETPAPVNNEENQA